MAESEARKLLLVGAHPDDELLGAGGTVARLTGEGWTARTLILGEGVTARGHTRDREGAADALEALRRQAVRANAAVGAGDVHFADFPDNRFDGVDLLDIIKVVERHVEEFEPSLVLTRDAGDLNLDHRLVHEAVITATRPVPGACVQEVLAFEVLSSTEWRYSQPFTPTVFFDISATLELKLEGLAHYAGEMRPFPHARSREAVEHLARLRGAHAGCAAAEAFVSVRALR